MLWKTTAKCNKRQKDADENNEHLHFQLRDRVVYSPGNIMSSALRRSSTLVRSLANVQARRLHSSGLRAAASGSGSVSPLNADDGKLGTKLYHAVNLVILAGVPAVIATSPSALTMPLDVVLGLAMPLHAHIGMNYVISDYVPKPFRGQARGAMLVASVVAALGLLKLNLTGPGITETLKSTWRTPKALEDESKKTKSDSSKE